MYVLPTPHLAPFTHFLPVAIFFNTCATNPKHNKRYLWKSTLCPIDIQQHQRRVSLFLYLLFLSLPFNHSSEYKSKFVFFSFSDFKSFVLLSSVIYWLWYIMWLFDICVWNLILWEMFLFWIVLVLIVIYLICHIELNSENNVDHRNQQKVVVTSVNGVQWCPPKKSYNIHRKVPFPPKSLFRKRWLFVFYFLFVW